MSRSMPKVIPEFNRPAMYLSSARTWPATRGVTGSREQLGRAHHGECGEDRHVGYGVDRSSAQSVADRHDEQAGEGGSRDTSHAVHGAVERHGVGHLAGRQTSSR